MHPAINYKQCKFNDFGIRNTCILQPQAMYFHLINTISEIKNDQIKDTIIKKTFLKEPESYFRCCDPFYSIYKPNNLTKLLLLFLHVIKSILHG